MYFVDTIEVPGLGNRGYLAGGARSAVVVDPPRDVDRVIAAAARRGVRITHVVETHVHNDYVTGGLELARITGAAYLVPAGALVAFERTPVADGDVTEIEDGLTLRALATPGHTPHHTSYALEEAGRAAVVFTGGSLLIGTVGRPDLVEPGLTGRLARAQYDSAHRLAAELPDETEVLPTHGFGSFCSAGQAEGGATTTIGRERGSNEALVKDVDTFVADLLAGLDDVPAYYAHMGPVNAQGPGPVDLTPPRRADREEIAARLAAGEWVVDLRDRRAFAEGHVAGTFNFEAEGQLATYLAWLVPWGRPVTLLAATLAQLADAQRELVRVGIDRPAAAATGSPAEWVREGDVPRSFPRATFADLAAQGSHGVVVLDVRRDSERSGGHLRGSVHIPLHRLRERLAEIPDGTVWVHCAGGMRAAVGASILDAVGRDVVAVDDGFASAAAAGLPMARITAEQAHERTGAGAEAVLLDVREQEEWEAGHAPGAVHAPLSELRSGGRLPRAVESRPVIAICRSGKRSRAAAELLTARGADAVDVLGGMEAWTRAGLPVEGAAPSGAGPTGTSAASPVPGSAVTGGACSSSGPEVTGAACPGFGPTVTDADSSPARAGSAGDGSAVTEPDVDGGSGDTAAEAASSGVPDDVRAERAVTGAGGDTATGPGVTRAPGDTATGPAETRAPSQTPTAPAETSTPGHTPAQAADGSPGAEGRAPASGAVARRTPATRAAVDTAARPA
ncbi:rhodanese-like domain-containing protein [Streptomyces pseudovenezuelae]|uniref:rhodanese-like domain-containing protein n=1 Tax=Streptomyces pseudovenezuelae TaxID=67350 RepID=UPI0038B49935